MFILVCPFMGPNCLGAHLIEWEVKIKEDQSDKIHVVFYLGSHKGLHL